MWCIFPLIYVGFLRIFSFIVSNKDLLIFPMSDFDGFIRRKDDVCGKPSLWSFFVRNASVFYFLASRLISFTPFLLDFLYVFLMLFLMFLISLLNFDKNLFRIGLNSMLLIFLCKSDSNSSKSSIAGGYFGDLKPKVCFLFHSNFPKNCNAFYLIRFVTLSTLDINCVIYSFSDGIAIFFFE